MLIQHALKEFTKAIDEIGCAIDKCHSSLRQAPTSRTTDPLHDPVLRVSLIGVASHARRTFLRTRDECAPVLDAVLTSDPDPTIARRREAISGLHRQYSQPSLTRKLRKR